MGRALRTPVDNEMSGSPRSAHWSHAAGHGAMHAFFGVELKEGSICRRSDLFGWVGAGAEECCGLGGEGMPSASINSGDSPITNG